MNRCFWCIHYRHNAKRSCVKGMKNRTGWDCPAFAFVTPYKKEQRRNWTSEVKLSTGRNKTIRVLNRGVVFGQ